MKKSIIIGVSVLSIFILCSLSYQPIIADTPIEPMPMAKKSKASDLDVDELKELYTKLLELKYQSKDDCGCGDTTGWGFPIICTTIYLFFIFLYFLSFIIPGEGPISGFTGLTKIGQALDCWWADGLNSFTM